MFGSLKRGLHGLVAKIKGVFQDAPETPSQREMRLTMAEYRAKRKLGASFFTRQLHWRTKQARIATLTTTERDIARARGWIR